MKMRAHQIRIDTSTPLTVFLSTLRINFHAYDPADETTFTLQSLGVVDVAGTNVQDNDVLAHALQNVARSDKEQGWAVKRSTDFVNEYPRRDSDGNVTDGFGDNPNHLLGCFPCLFPYGQGGFEVERLQKVSYEAHSRWAIRYHDKRFALDLHFIFQVFGVLQKRQLCAAAALQISRRAFQRYENDVRCLTSSDFEKAAEEERSKQPFSNAVMQSMRKTLSTVRANVMGTDESRIKIRSYIWGMCIKKNPPSIWLTINPADTQDPIAQVLTGQDINLDNFCASDYSLVDSTVTNDPYTSATFFHFIINAILEHLLGITPALNNRAPKSETGILGDIEAYIGTIEAQGRGTLHLHMILWLKGSPTLNQMKELLLSDEFRLKICSYIRANVRADLASFPGTSVLTIPRQKDVAFSRPIDPRLPNYTTRSMDAEYRIARTVQVHQCGLGCMKFEKGKTVCKRRAPFHLAEHDYVDSEGSWGPKRSFGFFNGWCPPILQCLCANHDIKLLTNGAETKDLAWYITAYIAKKQNASSNTSALLANTFAFHHSTEPQSHDLTSLNKKLIQRCGNTLSREQELSAPEVVSYLMGWGDRFISHCFETIPWYPLLNLLKKTFPTLSTTT
jgi:hypothetical protein